MKNKGPLFVRASISFPPDIYDTLERIAKRKKVSLAWVVRDAAERYVANETVVATEDAAQGASARAGKSRKAK